MSLDLIKLKEYKNIMGCTMSVSGGKITMGSGHSEPTKILSPQEIQ